MKYPKMEWGKMEAVVNKLGGMEGVDRFLSGELTVKASDLLRKLATAEVVGVARFVAIEHLKTANVGWMGDNFKKFFLGKVEESVGSDVIVVHRLEKDSRDAPIMTELGDRVEIKLAQFFGLLEKQSKDEAGPLLVNGYSNIAYITGSDGNLWAVGASWYSGNGYWIVGAYSVESPFGWRAGGQVLSRDS